MMPPAEILVFQTEAGECLVLNWLQTLQKIDPRAFSKCLTAIRVLKEHGSALRRPFADSLRDGVRELRVKVGRVNYRILYSFVGSNVALLTHGLTKESKVPNADIDVAIYRVRLAKINPETYTAIFDESEFVP